MNLTLQNSGASAAGLEWTFNYPAADVSALTAVPGPAAVAAGKTLTCAPGSGTLTCVLAGMNANAISDGVVGVVNVTMASTAHTAGVGISAVGADPSGSAVAVTANGATLTVAGISASVSVAPATVTLTDGQTQQFSAAVTGVTNTAVSWALVSGPGSISANGLYTAPTPVSARATAVVRATSAADSSASATASISLVPGAPAPTSSLSGIVLAAGQVEGGQSLANNRVTLSAAATSDTMVTLSSSNPAAASVPANVTIPAGGNSATFTITTTAIVANVTISASAAGNTVTAPLAVVVTPPETTPAPAPAPTPTPTPTTPPPAPTPTPTPTTPPPATAPVIASVRTNVDSAVGGFPVLVFFQLSGAAPAGGLTVQLSASGSQSVVLPGSAFVPAGVDAGAVLMSTLSVSSTTPVTVAASAGGRTVSTTLNLTPAGGSAPVPSTPPTSSVAVASLAPANSSIEGGTSTSMLITLTGPAPQGGVTVMLASSDPGALSLPSSVAIPAGATQGTCQLTAIPVDSARSVNITAQVNGQQKTISVQVR